MSPSELSDPKRLIPSWALISCSGKPVTESSSDCSYSCVLVIQPSIVINLLFCATIMSWLKNVFLTFLNIIIVIILALFKNEQWFPSNLLCWFPTAGANYNLDIFFQVHYTYLYVQCFFNKISL